MDKIMKKGDKSKRLMWCSDFCVDGNDIWMTHGELNALVNYNLQLKNTQVVAHFPDTKMIKSFLFIRIIKWKQKLILVPCFADYLFVYDLELGTFIFQRYVRNMYKTYMIYSDACIINDTIYCLPYEMGYPITAIELEHLEDVRFIELKNGLCNGNYINHGLSYGKDIYIVMPENNFLLKYDTIAQKIKIIKINGIKGLCRIICGNEKIYLQSLQEKKIIVYDPFLEEIEDSLKIEGMIGAICYLKENKVWVDTNDDYYCIANLKDKTIEKFYKLQGGRPLLNVPYCSGPAYSAGGCFYYFNRSRSCIVKFDGQEWKEYGVFIDGGYMEKLYEKFTNSNEIINEGNCLNLNDFIYAVLDREGGVRSERFGR